MLYVLIVVLHWGSHYQFQSTVEFLNPEACFNYGLRLERALGAYANTIAWSCQVKGAGEEPTAVPAPVKPSLPSRPHGGVP